jgi:phosphomevalonate kinase
VKGLVCVIPAIEAEAPGKLVLVGEYAILEGAPGLAVAVDVRAKARVAAIPGPGNQLVIPGTGQRFGFHWVPDSRPRWEQNSPGAFGLPLEMCAEILSTRGLLPRRSGLATCEIQLDTSAFFLTASGGERQKLGLGSSAAVVVALTGALLRLAGETSLSRQDLIDICCEAHRRLQGGVGSGIDVATSVTGGTVAVAAGQDPVTGARILQAQPVAWPGPLRLVAVWSGESAATPGMLGKLRAFGERSAREYSGHMQRLGAIAGQAVAAWKAANIGALLSAMATYESGLRRLDDAAGIGIFSPVHERLQAIAERHAAVYKPSGAGGGDFGIALTESPEAEQALRADYAAAGYQTLDAGLGAPGLTVRGSPVNGRSGSTPRRHPETHGRPGSRSSQ